MKLTKFLSVALVMCLTITAFASCDSNSSSTSQNQGEQQQQACNHIWNDANCETPKTCTVCSATEGKSLGHSWKEATCESPKTCTVCSATEGSALTDHLYKDGKCTYCQAVDPKESEFEAANDAYNYLTETHDLCVDVMDSIYGAWYFAIYKADDYSSTQSCFNAFCSEANLDYNDALDALNSVLQSMGYSNPTGIQQLAGLRTFSVTVEVVERVYQNNGVYNQIDNNLSNAKSSLKSVTNSYSDYTGYPTLKSYYSEASAYAEFCESPTGSFGQLKTTIDTYETNLRNYKNDLSFIFD